MFLKYLFTFKGDRNSLRQSALSAGWVEEWVGEIEADLRRGQIDRDVLALHAENIATLIGEELPMPDGSLNWCAQIMQFGLREMMDIQATGGANLPAIIAEKTAWTLGNDPAYLDAAYADVDPVEAALVVRKSALVFANGNLPDIQTKCLPAHVACRTEWTQEARAAITLRALELSCEPIDSQIRAEVQRAFMIIDDREAIHGPVAKVAIFGSPAVIRASWLDSIRCPPDTPAES